MTLFYNGIGEELTGEKLSGEAEELGFIPQNLRDARQAVRIMYGGWAGWNFKSVR